MKLKVCHSWPRATVDRRAASWDLRWIAEARSVCFAQCFSRSGSGFRTQRRPGTLHCTNTHRFDHQHRNGRPRTFTSIVSFSRGALAQRRHFAEKVPRWARSRN